MDASRDEVIPIEQLFFTDAGPHVLNGGSTLDTPATAASAAGAERATPSRGQALSDLLGTAITRLDSVSGGARRRKPGSPPAPIETLLYSGRAALDRALEIRNEVRATGIAPPRDVVEELLDLVALAATE